MDDLEKLVKNFASKEDLDKLYGNFKELRDEVDTTVSLVNYSLNI